MDIEKAKECVRYCILELKTRFLASSENYIIKLVTKDGCKLLSASGPAFPAPAA